MNKKENEMTQEQLIMWLQGALETRHISTMHGEDAKALLQQIKDHVALQFKKVTPELPKGPVKRDVVPKESLDEIWKRHVIKPNDIKITPPPYIPNMPNWGDPWERRFKPGEVIC